MKLVSQYLSAKSFIIEQGFEEEINWQKNISCSQITESGFLCELVWVILSSGMRETIIRKIFPKVAHAFYDLNHIDLIVNNQEQCKSNALKVFNHEKKIDAIIKIITEISMEGFNSFMKKVKTEGIPFLMKFPYLGPATSYHLAKNIGLNVVKPDRHLLRIADITGFKNPTQLCGFISEKVGDPISVVDIVIWRYATINNNYLDYFS